MNVNVHVPTSAYDFYCAERREFAIALRDDAFTSLPHDRVLACRLAYAFEQGIARLEPRSDGEPFWQQNSDGRAAYGGQSVGVDALLERHLCTRPDDEAVRWFCIASTLYFGDNNFASELFRPLVASDSRNLRWLIAGAVWVYALSAVDTSACLHDKLLPSQRQFAEFAGATDEAGGVENSHAKWAAAVGASVLAGATFPEMSRMDARWCGFPPQRESTT